MTKRKQPLLKKRTELLSDIKRHGDFIRGSVTRISKKGRPTSGYNLTHKDKNQKTITKYISKKHLRAVQRAIKNMEKVRKIIEKLSQLNLKILKQGGKDRW